MTKVTKDKATTGANAGKQLDRSGGFLSREEYAKSLTAQAESGKLSRHLRRAVKKLRKQGKV